MRLVSEYCLWWVFFGCSSTACFGGDNLTVEAAIAEAKQKKKYEFAVAAAPTPLPGAWVNKSQIPTEPRPDLPKPKLWSIWGVNDQYQAEIVYEGKVHQVPLRVGERFQHWVISDYSNQSLTLTTPWRSPSSTSMSNKLRGRDSREKQIANELTGAQRSIDCQLPWLRWVSLEHPSKTVSRIVTRDACTPKCQKLNTGKQICEQ
jgi:hypothetical protein